MKFADPLFLLALLLVIVPILIHFIQFKRYKTVYFSQVAFLKTLMNESKKRNNLKQLIILLCRISAVTFIVLAFARPYIPLNQQARLQDEVVVGIYLDNSFSMNGLSDKGTLLDKAKLEAIELANSFSPGTKFVILTNDPDPVSRLSLTKDQLISEIGKVKSSASNMEISRAVATLKTQIESSNAKTTSNIYLLSDFQKNFSDFGEIKPDSTSQVFVIPFAQQSTDNLLIDTCWLETPGRLQEQTELLKVRITNQSAKAYNNIPLKFYLNDSLKALQAVSLKAQETIETEVSYQNLKQGIHYCRLELDDYPITYDNAFYFSYKVESEVRALEISDENSEAVKWIEKLFSDDEQVKLSTMTSNKLQLGRFSAFQCIYLIDLKELSEGLQNALVKFAEAGGSIIMFPGETADIDNYNVLLRRLNVATYGSIQDSPLKIDGLNLQNHLFRDVFTRDYERVNLPSLYKSYPMQLPFQSLGSKVLTNNDGSTALYEFPYKLGRVYQFSFPLTSESTDFFRNALFVPVIFNVALHSYFPQTIQYELQPNTVINLKTDATFAVPESITMKQHEGNFSIQIPLAAGTTESIRFSTSDFVNEAGFYDLIGNDTVFGALAFNYSSRESDMNFYSLDELKAIASKSNFQLAQPETNAIGQYDLDSLNVIELWKYFIILAILFLLAELLVIRFWK
ncbi:vWA domain-containing protein [Mangrovibacterium diazotrophicum]|uniref:Putative membrane protein (TIGR02226 family) n=1 Tax=Mangrovibacterium diazotrophicum TaxID=1261403 RepID=A0A419W2R0_9BACT|nr:BatA and WFA domain-containing protein [Mangrovibacterium diazotrophicum]RKD89729.1 putative membrane protein (TIGR02226 family) [Mangrovibacterium diazotrophicum]